jgi:hypothetical protein
VDEFCPTRRCQHPPLSAIDQTSFLERFFQRKGPLSRPNSTRDSELLVNKIALRLLVVAIVAAVPQLAVAQNANDYNDMAAIVSEPIFDSDSSEKEEAAYADGGVMSRQEYIRQRLNDLRGLDARTQAAREKIAAPLWDCYRTYQEIRRLDSNTPDYEAIAKSALGATPALVKRYNKEDLSTDDKVAVGKLAVTAVWEIGGAIVNSYKVSAERDKFARHYQNSRSTTYQAMAGLVKARYANSSDTTDALETVVIESVDLSFANTYICDGIELKNDTGKDLTACTLLVKLSGENATTGRAENDAHFHFVGFWPKGEKRYLWYPSKSFSGIAVDQSVDVVRDVVVSVYCDQLATTAKYHFDAKEYDDYVKEWAEKHLSDSAFSGRWYTDEENFVDPAGFEVTYEGDLSVFNYKQIVVEAIEGDRSMRIRGNGNEWSGAEKKWICHKLFNPIHPGTIRVTISFAGTSYERVIEWQR